MQEQIRGAAWALAMWGVFSVVFGVLILAWPGVSLKAFLVLLGIYLVASGFVMAIGSLVSRNGHWVGGLLIGILSVIAGLYTFDHPHITAAAILTVIAIWAIAVGMLQVVAGLEGRNDWWMVFAGVVYTLFGFYIFARPGAGALTLIWLIGLSTIFSGVLMVVAASRTGGISKRLASS